MAARTGFSLWEHTHEEIKQPKSELEVHHLFQIPHSGYLSQPSGQQNKQIAHMHAHKENYFSHTEQTN